MCVFPSHDPTDGGAFSNFEAFTNRDGTGSDVTSDFVITNWDNFSQASVVTIQNNSGGTAYLTSMNVFGKPALPTNPQGIYVRAEDPTSVASYGERSIKIENDYIQTYEDATLIAETIVENRKDPSSYKRLTILGLPHLQLGDRVTRDGEDYWVIRIQGKFTIDDGLIQEIDIVKRTISPIS